MDLKPANIVMSKDWHAVLIDISEIGGFTREWLLPELFEASDESFKEWDIQVRSDTWALGKILSAIAEALLRGNDNERLFTGIEGDIEETEGRVALSTVITLRPKPGHSFYQQSNRHNINQLLSN